MMDSGGEGGLGVEIQINQFQQFGEPYDTKEGARQMAGLLYQSRKDLQDLADKISKSKELIPVSHELQEVLLKYSHDDGSIHLPDIETAITEGPISGKWYLWVRDRI